MPEYVLTNVAMGAPIVILLMIPFIFVASKNNRSKRIHRRVFIENPGTASADSFTVNCITGLPGALSLLSCPVTGLITLKKNEITFVGYDRQGMPVRLSLQSDAIDVGWLGKPSLFSNEYWFTVKNGEKIYYFSAENGKVFGGNETESREIYEMVKNRYQSLQ